LPERVNMNQAMLSSSMMCVSAWQDASRVLRELEESGVEWLHVDVMDGVFVPNLMMGTDDVLSLRRVCNIPLDIHFMIEKPEDKLDWFDIQPGELVSIHAESTHHLQRVLARIRDLGARPMVAINPATPLSAIEEVLCDVDGVLVMTVNPGFAGQKLVPQTLNKIARLRRMLEDMGRPEVLIEADGNVSFENTVKMRAAGTDIFVCGTSSLFNTVDTLPNNAKIMWESIRKGEEQWQR